jgi:hypothetical protein
VKEDQRLIKLLGLKQWKHLVLNGEDGLQKVSVPPQLFSNPLTCVDTMLFVCISFVFNLYFICLSFVLVFVVLFLVMVCAAF